MKLFLIKTPKLPFILVIITTLIIATFTGPITTKAASNGLTVQVTEKGLISLSVDGLGTNTASGIIQVEKPTGATVRGAYMAAAANGGNQPPPADGAIQIDGQDVNWDATFTVAMGGFTGNSWADVTALVKTKIDAAPVGRVDMVITEVVQVEGTVLAVIFDDPNQTQTNTIFLLFGGAATTGDSLTINTPTLNPATLIAEMSLGISFSYNASGGQYSNVDVNGTRMTSAAGHNDDADGGGTSSSLITVGGLDDNSANPADPLAHIIDDELYNLVPFVTNGDTSILVETQNPSGDDNIFFSSFFLNISASTPTPDTTGPTTTSSIPANGTTLTTGPSQLTITFDEDLSTATATDRDNYLLLEANGDGFQTGDCDSVLNGAGVAAADTQISINDPVAYNSSDFKSTLTLSAGALPYGSYRLYACGTTSIEDVGGNELNDGTSDSRIDFTVQAAALPGILPDTGFSPGQVYTLPVQTVEKAYSATGLDLEIPSLEIEMNIVGVLHSGDGWDTTWLGDKAGFLAGSAFPTWKGNTVLTGHVWDAYNNPGPFADIKELQYGDKIEIHSWDMVYTYEVQETRRLLPDRVDTAFEHEESDWITLITCENFNPIYNTYLYRRMVRAVLVDVSAR